jgi:tryptophan synthase alpha chain
MNRIAKTFEALSTSGRKGLVGYLTAGDPDATASEANILEAVRNGLDVLELGMPFSDPTADGPTIQAASHRALAAGMTLAGVLELVRRIRRESEIPIVLFGYVNPLFRYGYERVCADAAEAGVDGMLVVDLPYEETGELAGPLADNGLFRVPLIAPTTPPERAVVVLRGAAGFVYYIMFRGVTGARTAVAGDVGANLAALRSCTDLPIAVGFGVSDGAQARRVGASADAVVVGSALVKAALAGRTAEFVKELRAGLDGA